MVNTGCVPLLVELLAPQLNHTAVLSALPPPPPATDEGAAGLLLYVRWSGEEKPVHVTSDASVAELQSAVYAAFGLPPQAQQLSLHGAELGGGATLADQGVCCEAVVDGAPAPADNEPNIDALSAIGHYILGPIPSVHDLPSQRRRVATLVALGCDTRLRDDPCWRRRGAVGGGRARRGAATARLLRRER